MNQPSVTLILYAFNEERYIREAVESALAQDYSPLEIVLSDDGSTDGTFRIMQELAATHSGPHRVLLNQNAGQTGIGSQLNAGVAATKGDLIVLANGDDVSEANRVAKTVEDWVTHHWPSALWSDLRQIDEQGNDLGRVMDTRLNVADLTTGVWNRFSGAPAASLALSRDVFTTFGPLPENLVLEDSPLVLRAMLLKGVHHIPQPLVRYRVHKGNVSQSYAVGDFSEWCERNRKRAVWHKREGVKAYLQMLRDLYQKPADPWPEQDLKLARWAGMEKMVENAILHDYYAGDRAVPASVRLASMVRLAVTLAKAEAKRLMPFIERRNARWHFKQVLKAAGKNS